MHTERSALSGSTPGRPALGPPQPYFAYRLQLLVQLPEGSFDTHKNLNPGTGFWAVIPYVAATYRPAKRWEMSTRLHCQYNCSTSRIASPPAIPNLVYRSGQAGQLVYGNFTTSYRLTKRFYAGVNSYEFYQLNPDKTNGINAGKARETQAYVGPGGGFDFTPNNLLHVNLYLKVEAHNTTSGTSLQVQYIHRFQRGLEVPACRALFTRSRFSFIVCHSRRESASFPLQPEYRCAIGLLWV